VVDSYSYNGDGQRSQRIDSTGEFNFLWDFENILLETNSTDNISVVYTLRPNYYGDLISQWRSGTGSS
jgi:hypothetical protein